MSDSAPAGSERVRRRSHRKIRNLLLKREFQLKYTAMVVGLSSALSIALGSFVLLQVRENSRMLRLEAEFDPAFVQEIARSDATLTVMLVSALVAFNVLLALASIAVTHRIAGPIFVLERYLDTLADGRLPQMRQLRRGDEFRDLWAVLQRLVDVTEHHAKREVDVLQSVVSPLEHDPRGQPVATLLRELLDRRLRMLSTPDGDADPVGSLDDERSSA